MGCAGGKLGDTGCGAGVARTFSGTTLPEVVRVASDRILDALSPSRRRKLDSVREDYDEDEQLLVNEGMCVVGPYRQTALHKAAEFGDVHGVENYIANGALVDVKDDLKRTPLHFASDKGHAAVVTLLLRYRANIESMDCGKRTPLLDAVKGNRLDAARVLLDAGANHAVSGADVIMESSPLHICACKGNPKMARLLLDYGADLHHKNIQGYTPFAMAQDWGTAEICEFFKNVGGVR